MITEFDSKECPIAKVFDYIFCGLFAEIDNSYIQVRQRLMLSVHWKSLCNDSEIYYSDIRRYVALDMPRRCRLISKMREI